MILPLSIWILIKYLVFIFLVIYIVFSLVVVRQVQLMTNTIETGFESQLKFLSFIHLLFSIGVFVFSLLIL